MTGENKEDEMINKKTLLILLALILAFGTVTLFIPINLEATIYGTISGRVVDEITGEGVEGLIVDINIEGWQTLTDKNGYFKFEMVPTGEEYEVRVFIDKEPYYTKIYELEIIMEKGKNIILKDIIAKRGGAIEGTIKLWDGTPVSSMSVTVYAEGEWPGAYGGHPDENGYYRVSNIPAGIDLKVVVRCPDGGNVSRGYGRIIKEGIRVERDMTTKGINFIIPDDPTEIYGKVSFKDGEPLKAHLFFFKGDNEQMGDIYSDIDGNYSIKSIESGNYRMHVSFASGEISVSGKKEIYVGRGNKIRIDIIISEESIDFKEYEGPIISEDKKPLFQLEFVKYPKEIVIPKDLNKGEFNVKAVVYYRYNGRDILFYDQRDQVDKLPFVGNFAASKDTSISTSIYYFNKKEKKLPEAEEWLDLQSSLHGAIDAGQVVVFASDAVYSVEIEVDLLGWKELKEAIMNKDVAKIIIIIKECTISCDVREKTMKGKDFIGWKELMNEEFEFKINKTLEINVRYEK